MSLTQQIQRRLRDAYMRLDPHNGDLVRHLRALGEGVAQFRDEHRKGRLVDGVEGWVVEFGADSGDG